MKRSKKGGPVMRRISTFDEQPTPLGGRAPVALLLVALILTCGAWCQQNAPQARPGVTQPTVEQPAPISTEQAIYLVRTALLTLNDANRSGNYSVLRDLAAPEFQTRNTAADLAQIFADLRRRNFDLFAVALIAPQFNPAPALDASGRAHLAGSFPTRPLQISFDLTFQSVRGQWRLFAISVATPEAPAVHSQVNRPPINRAPSRRLPGLFYGARGLAGTAGWRW
jgi:hypothetical protein